MQIIEHDNGKKEIQLGENEYVETHGDGVLTVYKSISANEIELLGTYQAEEFYNELLNTVLEAQEPVAQTCINCPEPVTNEPIIDIYPKHPIL